MKTFRLVFVFVVVFFTRNIEEKKHQFISDKEKEANSILSYAVLRPGKFGRGDAVSIVLSCPVQS